MTPLEAAELLRTTHLNILMLMKRGVLEGEERDGEWLLSKESVLKLNSKGFEKTGGSGCRTGCASSSSCGCGGR